MRMFGDFYCPGTVQESVQELSRDSVLLSKTLNVFLYER